MGATNGRVLDVNGMFLGISLKVLGAMLAGAVLLAGLATVGLVQSQAPAAAATEQPLEIYGDR